MKKNPVLLNKTLVIGVLVLFTSVALIPPINANISKEYVDLTTEFYGLGRKHNIQLTPDEAEELDVFFDTIRVRLDNAESEDETIQIFNEGIKKLERYGLLVDMSVKQVQRLIIGRYQKSRLNPISLDENENRNCLIMGKTTHLWVQALPLRTLITLLRLLGPIINKNFLPFLTVFLLFSVLITDIVDEIRPLFLDAHIGWYTNGGEGWVWTKGVNDIVSWNGTLLGQIETEMWNLTGIVGFMGIKIRIRTTPSQEFFLGYARHVKIDYKEE
ncbi:MAG: hypothetical protein JSW60_00660 [Thermoplasmatales archaeon]|nr:MAG: hypothetical protein JSW60_00660 [Thermoplasmatales archaeon]